MNAGSKDQSNGWEAVALTFIAERRRSTVGVSSVQAWAKALPPGSAVLDLGCGPGTPRSEVLVSQGFTLFAVDASPSLANAYRSRFPNARVTCEPVEESSFFGRTFHGVLAWGLVFLLSADTQRRLIGRVAKALKPGGSFLFTAPAQAGTWADLSTGRPSLSLGASGYKSALADAGLMLVSEHEDKGENHYYQALKT